jgi:hypothetical protein
MDSYVQLRWLCRKCGEYAQFCYPEAEPEVGSCPKCGQKVTIQLARCTGQVTWFEPYVTKPSKTTRHFLVRSGKIKAGSGRPRKKPLNNEPYKYTPTEDTDDQSGSLSGQDAKGGTLR